MVQLKDLLKKCPILSIVFFPIIATLVYFTFFTLLEDGHYSLERMFGLYTILLLIRLVIYGIIFVIAYCILRKYVFPEILGFKFNFWFEMTFVIAIILFLIGSVAILALRTSISEDGSDIYDLDSILWVMRDGKPAYQMGHLNCSDQSRQFEVWRLVTCKIVDIPLKSYNVTITQYLTNGDSVVSTNENKLEFVGVENTRVILFQIDALTMNDERLLLETTREFKFPTRDQVMTRDSTTVGYLIALVAVILFSIPLLMLNLRDLYEKRKPEEDNENKTK